LNQSNNENIFDLSKGWDSLAADLLYANMICPPVELAFYERRIRENGGLALDQACGAGRHLFPLIELGLEVHGADASADAIQFAEKAGEKFGIMPVLFQQRMEDCEIPHSYGTIYIANGTFQVIGDRQQAFQTLERFLDHLAPGGQLLIELFIPESAISGAEVRDAEHPERWDPEPRRGAEGEIVTALWSEAVDLFEQTLLSKRRYELIIDGICIRTEVHAHVLCWYYKLEFTMMLESAGFEDIVTYADYTDQQATKDSKIVVYGARRPLQ